MSAQLASIILSSLEELFAYNASISLPPTRSARMYYLWTFSIATSYAWISSLPRLSGTIDGYEWKMRKHVLDNEQKIYCWMTRCLIEICSVCIPGFKPLGLLSKERLLYGWNAKEQEAFVHVLLRDTKFSEWKASWLKWWNARAMDGSVAAIAQPSLANFPNGSTGLNVHATQDFDSVATWPNPHQWTPLIVAGKKQGYLTACWGSVRSAGLRAEQEDTIHGTASTEFLGTSPERTAEMAALVSLCNGLTDTQKMIAEFWAGGPGTISPPGMAMWMWAQFMRGTNQCLEYVVWSGLDLAVHLFEGSRLTWALKKQYKEARPIQVIRHLFPDSLVSNYKGGEVTGALWMPYQTANFVTPPFPDFPSGHSTFSQCFALVMGRWFGDRIPNKICSFTSLPLLSPLFVRNKDLNLRRIEIEKGASEIQPKVAPAETVVLEFDTWQDMAESAGISRQYGGIHAQSAHLGGQAVARGVHEALKDSWKLRVDLSVVVKK
jgi:membrane-associated phospholipid phosphatase